MTLKETAQIITLLQANYADSFKNMSDDTLDGVVSLWHRILESEDYAVVEGAVLAHISTDASRFMPPVGIIKERIRKIMNPPEMTELEAWGLVKRALRNSAYNSGEEFARLPPVIQKLVGSPAQLRSWALQEDGTDDYIAGQFQRSYRARAEIERENMSLPPSVKAITDKLGAWDTERKALGDGGET